MKLLFAVRPPRHSHAHQVTLIRSHTHHGVCRSHACVPQVYFLGEAASTRKLVGAGVAIGGVTAYSLAKLYADQSAAAAATAKAKKAK